MPALERIYLDNAATTWPKPESVYVAVEQMMRGNGAAVGRAVFGDSASATQVVQQARRDLASFIGASSEASVVFTNSGTDSLSTAILGLLKPNDAVVTTAAEHNSVLRPLFHLKSTSGVQLKIVGCDETGLVSTSDLVNSIDDATRLLVINHVSNVTGTVQPVQEMIAAAKAKHPKLIVLLDAAQSLGHLPINVDQLGCDILAAPGHKGTLRSTRDGRVVYPPGRRRQGRSAALWRYRCVQRRRAPSDSDAGEIRSRKFERSGDRGVGRRVAVFKNRRSRGGQS